MIKYFKEAEKEKKTHLQKIYKQTKTSKQNETKYKIKTTTKSELKCPVKSRVKFLVSMPP